MCTDTSRNSICIISIPSCRQCIIYVLTLAMVLFFACSANCCSMGALFDVLNITNSTDNSTTLPATGQVNETEFMTIDPQDSYGVTSIDTGSYIDITSKTNPNQNNHNTTVDFEVTSFSTKSSSLDGQYDSEAVKVFSATDETLDDVSVGAAEHVSLFCSLTERTIISNEFLGNIIYETVPYCACENDTIIITDTPILLNVYAACSLNSVIEVNATVIGSGISVKILHSGINNPYTYFLAETLDQETAYCTSNLTRISVDDIPCISELCGNKFSLKFHNADLKLELSATGSHLVHEKPQMNETDIGTCNMTAYVGQVFSVSQTYEIPSTYTRNFFEFIWTFSSVELVDLRQFMITCPVLCRCSLGYREWHTECANVNEKSPMTTKHAIVYNRDIEGLSFENTSLHEIRHHAFRGLNKLKVLHLSLNNIQFLPPTICQNLPILINLEVDNNNLTNVTFTSLSNQCAKSLYVIDLNNNNIRELALEFYSFESLRMLSLASNELVSLHPGAFAQLHKLENLNLNNNKLIVLPENVFASLNLLYRLYLRNNELTSLPEDAFASLFELTILDLRGNELVSLPNAIFASLGKLEDLVLGNNNLMSLPKDAFASQDWLESLDLSSNGLVSLPNGTFASLSNLKDLFLSNNELISLPEDAFALQDSLKTLKLSSNELSSLSHELFLSLKELVTLDLSNNSITSLSHNMTSLTSLISLNLSRNSITLLPERVFVSLKELKSLDLRENSLTKFSHAFPHLCQISYLDLGKNNVIQILNDSFEHLTKILKLDLSENNMKTVFADAFVNMTEILYLNMSLNGLSNIPSLKNQKGLEILDLSSNKINKLEANQFLGLRNLLLLSLRNNMLTKLSPESFVGLYNMTYLDISLNFLKRMPSLICQDLLNVEILNVSHNNIQKIDPGALSNCSANLKAIDLRANDLYQITYKSFLDLGNSSIILVDEFSACCFTNSTQQCISKKARPEYLTCKRMLANTGLRISMFLLGLSAIVCNVVTFCVRVKEKDRNKVQTILILNLSLSDFLMGINMTLLAAADVYYANYFPSYSESWRKGYVCKIAGMLSILSSEASVFFITLISIDRMLGIKYPFSDRHLGSKSAKICAVLIWLFSLMLSVIPIALSGFVRGVLDISEVCVGIPMLRRSYLNTTRNFIEINFLSFTAEPTYDSSLLIVLLRGTVAQSGIRINQHTSEQTISYDVSKVTGSYPASYFSIIVFIGINLICFIVIACCYIQIFRSAKKTAKEASRNQGLLEQIRMAKKMFLIVFTDFCTWVPLCLVCVLAQCGLIIVPPEVYAWTVAFILPINSSINPFLYTLSEVIVDHLEKRRKEKELKENNGMRKQ